PVVRRNAALALREIGPAADAARPALVKALKDSDEKVKVTAAEALVRIQPGQEDDSALIAALEDTNPAVRANVALALAKRSYGASGAVPQLLKMTNDKDDDARAAAVEALGKVAPRTSKELLPALRTALKDKSGKVRAAAAGAMGELVPRDKEGKL